MKAPERKRKRRIVTMRRRKKRPEEHADEAWLLPYSDMLTLLLALFIVMFATSNVDNQKLQRMGKEFQAIFSSGTGILDKGGDSNLAMNIQDANNSVVKSTAADMSQSVIEEAQMNEIKKSLEKEIQKGGYADKVKVALSDEGLDISMQDVVLFNSGEADVIPAVYPLLKQISSILNNLDNSIKVAGYTDNVPIKNSKFRSNWDLSAMRAINVMNFMVDTGGLNSKNVSIQAYGEGMPKFDNSTAEGRAKNRRVEIIIIRKYAK